MMRDFLGAKIHLQKESVSLVSFSLLLLQWRFRLSLLGQPRDDVLWGSFPHSTQGMFKHDSNEVSRVYDLY